MELLYRRLKKSGKYRIIEHYLDYAAAGAGAVARHSMSFMKLYAEAGYVVICDNFLPVASCDKRKETKVIQLWHACGCYKKFGYDAKDDIPEDYHGANVYRNADLVTVSGEAAVKPFASAMRLPETCVKAIGVSRTDLYFKEVWKEQCREQFYEQYPEARGRKVVLWAPTFRGNAGMPELKPLDLKKLQQRLGNEYFVLASLHPHMRKTWTMDSDTAGNSARKQDIESSSEPGKGQETDQRSGQDYISSLSTEELYPVVDVMIADYSSLIYEYLLFRKPLVLYVPDLREYRIRRGFYMDIEKIPGKIVMKEEELARSIRSAGKSGDYAQNNTGIEEFLSTYMGACDGQATSRIMEWMEQG